MSFVSRARKTLAISTAVLVVSAGLAVAPLAVSAASAASSTSSAAAVLASVNKLRAGHSPSVPKLLPNGFIKAFASQYAAGMAKKKSIYADVTTKTDYPANPDNLVGYKVKVPKGTASSVYAYMKKQASTYMVDPSFNYGAIGWAKSGTTVYAVIVLFEYDTAPLDLLTEKTPVISGTAKVGGTLTAKVSTSPTSAVRTYEWKVAGVTAGTNASTYSPVLADLGKKITVTITASKDGYVTPASHTSAATKAVAKGTLTKTKPVVTGNRNDGSTLAVTVSPWGPGTVTLSYQWLRNGKAISGATDTQYLQSPKDIGKKIDVKVTGTEAGFTSSSVSTATKTTTKKGVVM